MRLDRIGFFTVGLYGLLFYLPQFFLHLVNPIIFDERFDRFEPLPYFVFIPIFFLLFFALKNTAVEKPLVSLCRRLHIQHLFENRAVVLPIALLHVVASYQIFKEYGVGIRFREEGLRSTSPLVVLAFFTASYARIWLLYQYFRLLNGLTPSRSVRWLAALFGLGLGFGFNGALDVVDLLASFILVMLKPQKIQSLLLKPTLETRLKKRFNHRSVLFFFLLPLIVFGIVYAGFINKMGADGVNEMTSEIGYWGVIRSTVVRASTSYFSVIAFATKRLYDFSFYEEIYSVPIDRLWYRLSLILSPDMPLERPEVLNINRLNLINYLSAPDARQLGVVGGASPGMIASGFYLAPFPLGFLLMAFFVILIARLVNRSFLGNNSKATFIFPFFLLIYFDIIFASPMDLLAIDPIAAYAVLMILALIAMTCEADKRVTITSA